VDSWDVNQWLYGVDISNYQEGLTDFHAVARAGFAFAFILCSDGTWKQPHFRRQLDGCRDAGMLVAAYHYQRANRSAAEQIRTIVEQVPVDVPVVVDVEEGSGIGVAGVDLTRAIVDGLRQRGYRVPLVYIPRWYWTAPVDHPTRPGLGYASLAGLPPLWASWYPDYVTRPKEDGARTLPRSVWDGYGGLPVLVTQFTSSGRVPGYGEAIDQNAFRGSREDFAVLLGGEVPDMQLDDTMPFWQDDENPIQPYTLRDGFYGMHLHAKKGHLLLQSVVVPLLQTMQAQLAAVTADPDITPEQLAQISNDAAMAAAMAQTTVVVAALRTELLPMVENALELVQDADNADEARRTATDLLNLLREALGAPPQAVPKQLGAATVNVADRNADGVRGGAAAPDGVGGPTPDDKTQE
jgi:hypothetical protein